jgi:hypothetical protein
MENKSVFMQLVLECERRDSILNLVNYLETTDFFTAPSSTIFHCNYPGGLLEHSLNVYLLLQEKVGKFKLNYSNDTVTIVSLFHDVCKANFYVEDKQAPSKAQIEYLKSLSKNMWAEITAQGFLSRSYVSTMIDWFVTGRKKDRPVYGNSYTVDDKLPLGHGEKSLYLISKYVDLTDEEAAAIRWHIAGFDAGVHFNYPSGFPFREAIKRYSLVTLLFTSDFEASNILET